MTIEENLVTYEAFGAVGDGVADDMAAICAAHDHANTYNLPVRTKPDATYHLGRKALTAIIATDTDWGTSRFTIDDTDVEDHKGSLFVMRSLLEPVTLQLDQLTRDQKEVEVRPEQDCHVLVESNEQRRYLRRGVNQNQGVPQHDCFILQRDGSIEGAIDWHYNTITRIEAHPIDATPLRLQGGSSLPLPTAWNRRSVITIGRGISKLPVPTLKLMA